MNGMCFCSRVTLSSSWLVFRYGRPMVIDSLFQKLSQNLQIYLQMYPPPPHRIGKVEVSQSNLWWWVRLQDYLCMGKMNFFSIAFLFSPIYLRLEGNVPLPPKDWNFFFKHEYYKFLSILPIDFFSIAFMFSPINLRLEGNVLPPPPTKDWKFFKHKYYRFLSILVMGDLPHFLAYLYF